MVMKMKQKMSIIEDIPPKREIRTDVFSFRCSKRHAQIIRDNAKKEGYDLGAWLLMAALNFKISK